MFNNILKSKNKPYAILLVESKLCDLDKFINDYMKSIVCTGDNCEWCKKIETNSYYDLIKINGYRETIKKEQIANIIDSFSKSSIESRGIKFYIIHGIEYATAQAINSLLKFLEEPPKGTYAILTTRSVNLILPTIKSRCQAYTIKSNISNLNNQLGKFKIDEEQKQIIRNVYYSYGDVINDLASGSFDASYQFAHKLMNSPKDLRNIKKLSDEFKKMDYKQIELVLQILNSMCTDEKIFEWIMNVKFNPTKILLFNRLWTIVMENK